MKKLLSSLAFSVVTLLFLAQSSSAVMEDGIPCSGMLDWAPYGCDAQYDSCIAECGDMYDGYDGYGMDEDMYCYEDCDYQYMECQEFSVHNGYVVGNGVVSSPGGQGMFNFSLSCDNGGLFIANAQVGYNYYSLYVQNTENYCYEYPWEGRFICGHGTGTLNGQPIDVAWCANIDQNTISISIDDVTICEEVEYGYIYPIMWTSPLFDGLEE